MEVSQWFTCIKANFRDSCAVDTEIPAVIIIKIGCLKARRCRAFKQPILVFPVPLALKTPKSVS